MSAGSSTAVSLVSNAPAFDWAEFVKAQSTNKPSAELFAKLGLPHRRQEDWKYTQFASLAKGEWTLADSAELTLPALALSNAWRIVISNGQFDSAASILPDQEGVNVALQEADQPVGNDAFEAMNAAIVTSVLAVSVDANVVADQPIELLILNDLAATELAASRVQLELGVSSQLEVIEYHLSGNDDASGFATHVCDVKLAANSQLNHVRVQQLSLAAAEYSAANISIARDARYISDAFELGGRTVRNNIRVDLAAPGGSVDLGGLYTPTGRQHQDTHSWITHSAADCVSREIYKGVLDQRGRAVFNGSVRVERDAQRTDSEMQNRNVLLSRHAEVDTKPELEIYADDVKCGHGATVGELDPTAMFYLQSRGISKDEARSLLVFAFVAELVERVSNVELRHYLAKAFAAKLPGGNSVDIEALAWGDERGEQS